MKADQSDECRWDNYNTYRVMLWAWMINEISIVFTPVDLSHNGFYVHAVLYGLSVIFIGIPLVYTEICLVQYTDFDAVNMWKFFPLFKIAGYASVYLVILKAMYLNVISSWYLVFGFHSTNDPPPWFSCEEFKDPTCMVKRVNISIFQHCLETQMLFNIDCGMKTASYFFFEREIGNYSSLLGTCFNMWKPIVAMCVTNFILYILCIKRNKLLSSFSNFYSVIFGIVLFLLLCASLCTDGTWFATKMVMKWEYIQYESCLHIITRGVLTCGTGLGVIGFLTRGVSFRSPATMTAISVTLFAVICSIFYGLILFNGIKTMSYYHGEEDNVIEVGDNSFFNSFASVVETLSYFNHLFLWPLLWYLTIYLSLFVNIWILYLFLYDHILDYYNLSTKRRIFFCLLLIIFICLLSYPFYCCDLTEVLLDVIEILQLANSFLFSMGVYWVYGYKNHVTDITFMIGIKASMVWKTAFVLNPLILLLLLFLRLSKLQINVYNNSVFVASINIKLDQLLFWLLVSIYLAILFIGMVIEVRYYVIHDEIKNIFFPAQDWGPNDKVLFKSRKMFVPEIMTREFLYRQVKIHGYSKTKRVSHKIDNETNSEESTSYKTEWNALTSN